MHSVLVGLARVSRGLVTGGGSRRRRCRARHDSNGPCGIPPSFRVLGGGQLGRMLALAGHPLGIEFRFLDPSPAAPAGALGPLVVGELGDVDRARRARRGRDGRHLRVGGRARRRRARSRPGTHRCARPPRARRGPGPARREGDVPTARHRRRCVRGRRRARRTSTRRRRVGLPAVLKTRRGGYDGKGQRAADTGRHRRRVGRARRRSAHLRGARPVRPRASVARGARRSTATYAC